MSTDRHPEDAPAGSEASADGRPAPEEDVSRPAPVAVGERDDQPAPEGTPSPTSASPAVVPRPERPAEPPPVGSGPTTAAEALAAAVRAVESGERSAASFFTEPTPATRPEPSQRPPLASAAGASHAAAPGGARDQPLAAGAETDRHRADVPIAERARRAAEVRAVLASGQAPDTLAEPALTQLGERAASELRGDPWRLLAVPGVRPERADDFARALLGAGCDPGDERRRRALVGWLMERAARVGHTAVAPRTLRDELARHAVPAPDEALRTAIADGDVLVFHDTGDVSDRAEDSSPDPEPPVRVLLGLERYALAEESLADGLGRLAHTSPAAGGAGGGMAESVSGDPDPAGSEPDWEATATAAPSPSAAELIRAVGRSGLVLHSGGTAARAEPAALLAAAAGAGLRAHAATHTEAGRRRLTTLIDRYRPAGVSATGTADSTVTDQPASAGGGALTSTVAGLLAGREGPGRQPDGTLAVDLLAVLDAPQLDVETAAVLVESLPDGARLLLSGDPGVLGSAGAGRVFADLLSAGRCPTVVSRTPDPGPIGDLVSGVGVGELNPVQTPEKDVVIVPVRGADEAVHRAVQLVGDSVPRAIGVPSEHTQVITPGHGGAAGTRVLNDALKERFNPGPGRFGGFDPGDRVAFTPTPGRTQPGVVLSGDDSGLRVECSGETVALSPERVADSLRHGWAMTAHQAAGLYWPAVVVVLPGDATAPLSRSWVYTAFGRAERHLSVVQGAGDALPRAVARPPDNERTTRLRTLLLPAR